MREIVKVREDFELEGLEKYGFVRQDYLNEYGRTEKTGCYLWRLKDNNSSYGITIFEKVPTKGYFAPDEFDIEQKIYPRQIIMMQDESMYMESASFNINPVIFDLVKDGVVVKEVVE